MEPNVEKYVDQLPWYFKSEIQYIDGWFLMGTPGPVMVILFAYLVFSLKVGPAFMENRPALKLKIPLLIYNVAQVLYSAYVFWTGMTIILKYGLVRKKCMIDVPDVQLTATSAFHYYLMAKVSELLDTVFFVLRKKKTQITFLHVYHHTLMVAATWGMLKYNPTYVIILIGTINSFVHILMYAYYGLSAFPSLDKYLWWKKYLTAFQLIQFGIMIVHAAVATAVSECTPSYILLFTIFFNVLLMIYLFSDFYLKSYVKKEDNIQVKSKNGHLKLNTNGFSHRTNKDS
ncbi:very long chain fatty acid elongase 2-like [Choristoneura fumiferana]|uniref:very long chain fatty acid elongase 2-like n=1 Tax=Choristoneura fumiferana TaxID=7141 RepID=UPI003D153CD4